MARGGRGTFTVDDTAFQQRLQVLLHHVERGTKIATEAAAKEIVEESLRQVPRDTETLANSLDYRIIGSYKNFKAQIGYGMRGDPINPKTGERASEYMVTVHEDLAAYHPRGKAKFLEDPIRDYQAKAGGRVANMVRREVGL